MRLTFGEERPKFALSSMFSRLANRNLQRRDHYKLKQAEVEEGRSFSLQLGFLYQLCYKPAE